MKSDQRTYCICLITILLILVFGKAEAQNQENVIKTAYIGKFANFIEWPDNKASDDNLFSIAVVGDTDLCDIVRKAFNNREVKNMMVNVSCHMSVKDLSDTDLLVLLSDKVKELDLALELCKKDRYLIISSTAGFARKGAHINFFITDEQTLHFEMNKTNLDHDGFKVDFLLLDYAKIVKK